MAETPSQDVKLYNIKRSLDNILERGKAPAKVMYMGWGLATLLVFFMLLCGSGSSAIVSFFAAIGAAVLLGGGSFWGLRFYLQKRRQAALEEFNRRFPAGSERRYTAMNLLQSLLETPKEKLKGKVDYDFLKELYMDLGGTDLPPQALNTGFGSDGPPLLETSTWKPLGDVMADMMASLPKGSELQMPQGSESSTQTQADGSVVETSTSTTDDGNTTISKQVITSPDGSSQTVIHTSSSTSISYDQLPAELQADYLPKDLPIIDLSKLPKDMKVQTLPDGSILLPYPNEGADYMVFHPTGSKLPEGAAPVPPPPPSTSSFKPIPVPLSPPGPIQKKSKKKPKKQKKGGGVELVYDFIPLDLDPHDPEEVASSWDDHHKELLLDCFCGAHLKVPAELRGKQAKCSKCERTLDVPE